MQVAPANPCAFPLLNNCHHQRRRTSIIFLHRLKQFTVLPIFMAWAPGLRACDACAKSKRRCGKQILQCLRCKTRGIECSYAPAKPSQFVLLRDEDSTEFSPSSTSELTLSSPGIYNAVAGEADLSMEIDLSGSSGGLELIGDQLASGWFASLETWVVRFPKVECRTWSTSDLKRFVDSIHRWMVQLVETGSNPFIHGRLYRTRFPRCIQDAYAALTCYLHKTEANERVVFRIIEDKVKELVSEYSPTNKQAENKTTLDPLEHLARVHSLIIYQFISLYDGDIRLRHLAEARIPLLDSWQREMVKHCTQNTSLGGCIVRQPGAGWSPTYIVENDNMLWYSWIIAESVRRAWVLGSGIQVVFLGIQQGSSPPCQGGMMFTTRINVWEVPSAMAWEKLCSEVHIGLMQMAEADRVFTEVAPEEVNEFTKVVLDITFGRERLERWGVQIDDG